MEQQDIKTIENHFATWSERDKAVRAADIPRIYAENLEIIDPHFHAIGYADLNAHIEELHIKFPDYRFTLRKPIEQHHNVGRLFWQLGTAETPDFETGMDVFMMENGKIRTLLVFNDPND
jgi:hypothetical protein